MFYSLAKFIVRTWLLVYHRRKINGLDRIPFEGPFILVGNHISYLDPFYIGAIIPRRVHFMAKHESFRHPITRWCLHKMHAFPVKRGESDLKAIRQALAVLQRGDVMGIFPEGGRRDNQELQEIKQGAAYLALKTGCPVVPVLVQGTERALPRGRIFLRPVRIQITIGSPIQIPSSGKSRQKQEELSEKILGTLREMKDATAS